MKKLINPMPVDLKYENGLTNKIAMEMISEGIKESNKQDVPMVIAICDSGGNLLALSRMDNAPLVSIEIAINKTKTAVYGKRPTEHWKNDFQAGKLVPLYFHEKWITFGGGFPIIKNNSILGGIGVSGGTIEDTFVARAMLKAFGFEYKEADKCIEERINAMEKKQ